jgi:hypothetical protein
MRKGSEICRAVPTNVLLVLSSPFFGPARSRIAELAIQQRLPTMFIFKTYVEAGGLMSYDVNAQANYNVIFFYMFCADEHAAGSRLATARNIRSVQLVIQELRVRAAS